MVCHGGGQGQHVVQRRRQRGLIHGVVVIREGFLEEVELGPEEWGGFGGKEDIPGGREGFAKDEELRKGKAFME